MSQTPPTEASTHVRYQVVALATLMAVFLYLDRYCLSFVERYIKEDLDLSNAEMSWLLSAFFWAYALGQVPSGWLSDRYGARIMLALYIVAWSVFTGVMGLAFSFWAMFVLRFGCGLGQAGAYPTSGNLLSKWVSFRERGLASGIVSTGGRLGGFIAPILTALLIVAFVPVDHSSLLDADDIQNPAVLGEKLRATGDRPDERLATAIRGLMPSSTPGVIFSASLLPPIVVPDDEVSLRESLNAVLQRKELYERINADDFALPKEARTLAMLPEDELTPAKIERRNRLLLETAYPDAIRKLYGSGWRPVMVVYGVLGIVVAGLFWLFVRDQPRDHPACNEAELEVIEEGRPAGSASPHGRAEGLPFVYLLVSRSLWLCSISQFWINFGWLFIVTWFPRYLADEHHVPIQERGMMASTPILCGIAGMLAGGWLTDWLTRQMGLFWGRCLPMVVTRFGAAAAFVACLVLDSPWAITISLSLVAVCTDLGVPAIWAYVQDTGGKHVGSVLGWGNMWGNIGAALSPVILNEVIQRSGWDAMFMVCAAAMALSGLVSLGIDARIPIVPEDAQG